ncbi:hypothetical protein H1R20_g10383, partial [Candolleomyces eurysporus]
MDISRYTAGYSGPSNLDSSLSFWNLNRLRLYTTEQTLSIFRILDILVLPALSTLQIGGEFDFDSARPLFSKILLLVQRSGCSMKNLTLTAPLDTQQEEFYEILRLSPGLQHLEVPHIGSQGLRKLVLDMGDDPRNQLIPDLRILKLCWYGSDPKNPTRGLNGVIDVTALREMVVSRTTAKHMFLEEVHLSRYHNLTLSAQLEYQWNPTAIPEVTLAALAQTFEESLGYLHQCSFWHHSNDPYQRIRHELTYADASLHERLDQEMRDLENIDLADYADTLVLAVRLPNL